MKKRPLITVVLISAAVFLAVGAQLYSILEAERETDSNASASRVAPVPAKPPAPPVLARVTPADTTYVIALLEGARADHLGFCGYGRPTSPAIDALAKSAAVASCESKAAGQTTFDAVARLLAGEDATGTDLGTSLKDELETLAEQLKRRGYQTVFLSGNPGLDKASGVQQGFDYRLVFNSYEEGFHPRLADQFRFALSKLNDKKPLFLFVVISDPQLPWASIPNGVPWLPARPGMSKDDSGLKAFMDGTLSKNEQKTFHERVTDLYDFALSRSDFALGQMMRTLAESGWLDGEHRVLLTSDNGIVLGMDPSPVPLLVLGAPLNEEPVTALAARQLFSKPLER